MNSFSFFITIGNCTLEKIITLKWWKSMLNPNSALYYHILLTEVQFIVITDMSRIGNQTCLFVYLFLLLLSHQIR